MEKGSFPTYRLFVYFDGVKQLNVSVGSISVGQYIGLGFWYLTLFKPTLRLLL
ncbi:SSV-like protein [Sulfolobus islandicus LAL14/1]|uniref:SSV-like protein n=1 Tax=Saccharolobus islandicus LAL14/1 TaxID=1241935 RepID=M9UCE0_SACIS|nr:SSV-like protein [Sulfolobus islandicus LAL14/1]